MFIIIIFVAIMCTDLPTPDNGQVSYASDTTAPYDFGTEATYVCNSGFGIVGSRTRMCTGNNSTTIGTWTVTAPTCEGTYPLALTLL